MKKRKAITITALVSMGLVLALAVSALALDQVNGTGVTHNGGSLGFNAKADLTGNLDYHSPDGAIATDGTTPVDIDVHCNDYFLYREKLTGTPDPIYPYVRVRSKTCIDKVSGAAVVVQGEFVDRGEPGTNDTARLLFCWTGPCKTSTAFYIDGGKIQKGNVQIHTDPTAPETQLVVDTPTA
ncbi:MAG: hypothetical protein QOI81_494 [Actinomycetota bacterium]|jgi:hypothetical protein|nr:hypothetical protein [Actinomycetota bacterium]